MAYTFWPTPVISDMAVRYDSTAEDVSFQVAKLIASCKLASYKALCRSNFLYNLSKFMSKLLISWQRNNLSTFDYFDNNWF